MTAIEELAERVEALEAELLHLVEAIDNAGEDLPASLLEQTEQARTLLFGENHG